MILEHADTAPADITERHRPRFLDEVVGQEWVVYQLREWLQAPYPTCLLFEGGTGVGKSTVAAALAREIGCDVEAKEWGGFYKIASGEQSADRVRDLIQATWTTPMGSPTGWRVVVVEEADALSSNPTVERIWLTGLEELAPKTVIIFTTNYAAKMTDRIVHRFDRMPFESRAAILMQSAQTLIDAVWLKETGSMEDVPKAEALPGLTDANGNISFRVAVKLLAPMIRRRRARLAGRDVAAPPTVPLVAPTPTAPRNVNAGAPRAARPAALPDTPAALADTVDILENRVANLSAELERAGEEYNEADAEAEAVKRQIKRARRDGGPTAQLDADLVRWERKLEIVGDRVCSLDDAVKSARRDLKAARKKAGASRV